MKKNRHENLKCAVSSYLKRRNYTTAEISFRRSEFSHGVSLQELVKDEELQASLTQDNVICFNSSSPDLGALDAQLSRLKVWLVGLPSATSKELSQIIPTVVGHMYLEAISTGTSRTGAFKFLQLHHQPDELLDELVSAGSCPELLTRPNVLRFKSGHTLVPVSSLSLSVLQRFLSNKDFSHLLQAIGQWIKFVSPENEGAEEEELNSGTVDMLLELQQEENIKVEPFEIMLVKEEVEEDQEEREGEEAQLEDLQEAIAAARQGPHTPTPLRVFFIMNCEKNPVSCTVLDSKATLLAGGLENGSVQMWSLSQDCLSSGLSSQCLLGHTGPVRALTWLGRGCQALVSASMDHDIRLWPSDTYNCAAVYRGHVGAVWALATCPIDKYFASASADLTLRLWSPEFAYPLRSYCSHTQAPMSLAFHPNGLYLASGARDCTVRLWDTSAGRLVRLLNGHRGGVCCLSFNPNGKTLASAGFENCIRIWDLAQGSCQLELPAPACGVSQLEWSEDSSCLAAASPDGSVTVWDMTQLVEGQPLNIANYATNMLSVLTLKFSKLSLTCVGTGS